MLTIITLVNMAIRFLVASNSYSGFGKPPLHGDFEAQRHWMEITYNLPVDQWYKNSTENDLQYWGLDYPPLTAYHSWLCGYIANHLNSSWVELHTSRGIEEINHKLFMRITVIVADLLIYLSAVYVYFSYCADIEKKTKKLWCISLSLLYPGIILVDHGHFQYNCVSLGLTLWAVIFLCLEYDVLGSAVFVLALNYKQMELYYALPFFCYLLGKCFRGGENWFVKLVKLGLTVIVIFLLCWFPFLTNMDSMMQVLHRIFPVARGLYEDKVANFWCSISVVIKLKDLFDTATILRICLVTTVLFILPSSFHVLLKPTVKTFKIAMINSSLVFFLFSFHVHEKSILLVALPVLFILHEQPHICRWFLQISTFSMLPLLIRDGLLIPSITLIALYHFYSDVIYNQTGDFPQNRKYLRIVELISMGGAVVLTLLTLTVSPPARYPDLWSVLVSIYSSGHFMLFLGLCHYWQFTVDSTVINVKWKSPQKHRKRNLVKKQS